MNSANCRFDKRWVSYILFTLLGIALLFVLLDPGSGEGSFSTGPIEEELPVVSQDASRPKEVGKQKKPAATALEGLRSQPAGQEETDTRPLPLEGKDEERLYDTAAKKVGGIVASVASSPPPAGHLREEGEDDEQPGGSPPSQKDRAEDVEDDFYDVGGPSRESDGDKTDGEQQQKQPDIAATAGNCDMYSSGRWVYDPETYPLYRASQCPLLSPQVSCQKNGRPDSDYERWRWEPSGSGCEIPRFNGTVLLEMLRGKRVVFVGDSLNANMWESMACLLYTSVPKSRAEVVSYRVFKAKDYDCTLESSSSPFLVDLDNRVLRLDKISRKSVKWQGADILVFNSGHWWTHTGRMRAWNMAEQDGEMVKEIGRDASFERAMQTWAKWIDNNINPSKTTVFFRSVSPVHFMESWCYNQTQPITDSTYVERFPETMIRIVEKTIAGMRTPVEYLNITGLTQYRKDAHSSLYHTTQSKLHVQEPRQADCSHWCLPGVPDTWNLLIYASLLRKSKTIL